MSAVGLRSDDLVDLGFCTSIDATCGSSAMSTCGLMVSHLAIDDLLLVAAAEFAGDLFRLETLIRRVSLASAGIK